MAATDTQLQQLVINVGTDAQIRAGIAGGTITEDMLSIATDGADISYDWVGTLAEYNEQDIATNHPDWLCFITDDVNKSGEDVYDNVYSKTEADEIFVAKTDGVAYLPNLLEFKWSDHILNTVSWLRADTFSWQSGELYEVAYQHLVNDIEGKALQTETIGGVTISYYLADDMHKICPANQESNVASLYTNTGVAWYFILDTTNARFKLPRTKFGFTGLRSEVGKYVAPGLPNITGTMQDRGTAGAGAGYYSDTTGAFKAQFAPSYNQAWAQVTQQQNKDLKFTIGFNASLSNSIYGASTTVQAPATEMYLYFYVGEFAQDAIINTDGITEALNSKVDKGHEVIEFQVPTAGNDYTWYRKYADGWVEQGGTVSITTNPQQVDIPLSFADTHYTLTTCNADIDSNANVICNAYYSKAVNNFTVVSGFNGTFYNTTLDWMACGMAA